jgi:translocation and assembly module TamA
MLGLARGGLLLFLSVMLMLPATGLAAARVRVQLDGLEGDERKNALALMDIEQRASDEGLDDHVINRLHRRAPDQIKKALQPFGYYQVKVEAELRKPAAEGDPWEARYRVERGEPVKIGEVDFEVSGPGAKDAAFPTEFAMHPGDRLIHADFDDGVRNLADTAAKHGYLDASFDKHRVIVDPEDNRGRVEVALATGPQYYLGEVTFKQDLLEDEFLRRYIRFKPGEVYDPGRLLNLQASLLASEYYDQVEIVPRKDEAEENVIPLDVVATPNKPNKYRIGAGYSTDTGPRLRFDWTRRYVGRWGHRMNAELNVSPALTFLRGEYRIPLDKPTQDIIFLRPNIEHYDTSTRKGTIGELGAGHSVVLENGWRRILGLSYRYEDYTDVDGTNTASELVPNISWSKTVSDDPVVTRNGYRIQAGVLGAVEGLISSTSYLSVQAFAKWIRSFGEDYRFITRANLGATLAKDVLDLPASRRFYAGGDTSIRGWGVDVLGPNDAEDKTVGGRYLGVGSLELERRIYGDWGAAMFYDFGNAFDPDYSAGFKQAAGLGLRWRTPVGLVRVDVAYKVGEPGHQARLNIVVGPDL